MGTPSHWWGCDLGQPQGRGSHSACGSWACAGPEFPPGWRPTRNAYSRTQQPHPEPERSTLTAALTAGLGVCSGRVHSAEDAETASARTPHPIMWTQETARTSVRLPHGQVRGRGGAAGLDARDPHAHPGKSLSCALKTRALLCMSVTLQNNYVLKIVERENKQTRAGVPDPAGKAVCAPPRLRGPPRSSDSGKEHRGH